MKKFLPIIFCVALSTVVYAPTTIAKNRPRFIKKSTSTVVNAQSTTIAKNTPGFIKKATDLGAVDPSTVITVTAWLNLHNQT
jgi:hypothetical protein